LKYSVPASPEKAGRFYRAAFYVLHREPVVAAAVATFCCFETWLNGWAAQGNA
jgi:hypothetical protein